MKIRWMGDGWEKDVISVELSTSFLDWEPVPMIKINHYWENLTLSIPPGTHLFFFLVNGTRHVDPTQPHVKLPGGKQYNTISSDPTNSINPFALFSNAAKTPTSSSSLNLHHLHSHSHSHSHSSTPSSSSSSHLRFSHGEQYRYRDNGHFFNQFLIRGVSLGSIVESDTEDEDSEDTTKRLNERKLIIVMVGLPARGKSFTSRKLCRFLNWSGCAAKVFNYGTYRRENMSGFQDSSFFSNLNKEGVKLRDKFAKMAMGDATNFLKSGGDIAILDGTNSNVARRQMVYDYFKKTANFGFSVKIVYVEIICTDQAVIRENVLAAKVMSPDYKGKVSPDKVIEDFMDRVKNYEKTYQPLGTHGEDRSYIKIIDLGRQLAVNRIHGYLLCRVLYYISNLHTLPRPIYLARHGQSEFNVNTRLGGDSSLTAMGKRFGVSLGEFLQDFDQGISQLAIWSSTMKRTTETAEILREHCAQYVKWKALDEIDAGICDGMTYEEIKEKMPDEYEARQKDKLRYRYPRGESYEDLVRRVEPVIMELERSRRPLLILGHQAVLRCLYAYLTDTDQEDMPHIEIPIHTVMKITTHAYGTRVENFKIEVPEE
mmetsp:Transcript_22441/g.30853  ORF Transcript_22441/g.30853 Transcript_22441/m.30853 type:complete len:598 (+) Transcript_22441:33-1826(+)|eukprot:CAMPEP_0201492668 /NCGR_PEP_ID=MMETSP0151_2-20130828/34233_1 /ASSEMBLY_ACC=CAM_ASM_000257 /TAXON_ID=200890 /ORGANISM="Paramoeba atlantica, Strain 621/1 / CCAP 1560/9" /LENGTH=597 /DNA_ID=CAMNT_0047879621 /DNA_START=32 /DNA_END=1825 /DNA_ORIENTATION=+